MAPLPHRLAVSLALVAVALVCVAGCGEQGSPAASGDPTGVTTGVTPAASPSQEPSEQPNLESSTKPSLGPTESPSPPPAATAGATATTRAPITAKPTGHRVGHRTGLLSAHDLPTMGSAHTWQGSGTHREGRDPSASCHRTPLTTIGATGAVVRTFQSAGQIDGPAAHQVVATFADTKSAWRSYQVLLSWRAQCPGFRDGAKVSPLTEIGVPGAVAHRFVVSGTSPDRYLSAVGMIRRGAVISLVEYVSQRPGWDYPAGREPESRAIRRMGELLAQHGG